MCDRMGEKIQLIVFATGEKSERPDVYSRHGFFKISQPTDGVKHRTIATEHGCYIDMIGKFSGGDAAVLVSESGCLEIQHRSAAVRNQGSSECM